MLSLSRLISTRARIIGLALSTVLERQRRVRLRLALSRQNFEG